ncbi:esterase OVCA2-like isoform X2 [Saccostrea echinata]|uniref:esterase OVCA2-like isoform X2 n=1 Tax=Saccostrea echinata TaxID=191078 RepID=UPI002A831C80|nr:esterase OVCA2-like isoform X2 [Saccostrea echinata]
MSLKILCIHGYRQNDQTFRERTGAFRKIIKKISDPAPNLVPPLDRNDEDGATDNNDQRGWWFSSPDDQYTAQDYTDCCKGYKESLEIIEKAFREQGPFDGILAFSQGAAMASLICGLKEQDPEGPFQFDFVILVAGFKSRQKQHESIYKKPITTPSLHVFGDSDKVIQKEMSEDLLQYFVNPSVLKHSGGHFIPVSSIQKKVYIEFLQPFLDRKKKQMTV